VGPVSKISMDIVQNSDGTVTGNWSGTTVPAACPPELNATPAGPVNGTNTVLDVRLALAGVGDFSGQLIDRSSLKGSLQSCGLIYPIIFSLVTSPTG
jgi:hypothetical protein